MTPETRIRLEDMLSYATGASAILARHGRDGVMGDWGLQQGLIKAVEVVGEAAYKIPKAERPPLGGLPWAQVTGLRHHLVHGYGAIRMEVLFDVVERRLPPLIVELEKLLGDTP